MSRKGRRKKLRITIVANDPRDAKRILDAIGDAARAESKNVVQPIESEALSEIVPTVPDERLETEVNRTASNALHRAKEDAESSNSAMGLSADASRRESAEEIVIKRGRVRAWFRSAGALAYRTTIKVVADLVKEMSTPS